MLAALAVAALTLFAGQARAAGTAQSTSGASTSATVTTTATVDPNTPVLVTSQNKSPAGYRLYGPDDERRVR